MVTGPGVFAGTTGAVVGTLWLAVGVSVYEMGAVKVSVQEKTRDGHHIYLIVPGAVVPLGLKLVPKAKLRDVSTELRPWLPVIQIASEELARCPDGVLVEVEDFRDKVSIVKRGGTLVIDVDSADATVHVSLPLKVVALVARHFQTIAPTFSEHSPAPFHPSGS